MTPLSKLKLKVLSPGRKPRRIVAGPFKNLVMHLDLHSQTQFLIGTFERETHKSLTTFSKNIASVIDVGAADGEYTVFFAARTGASVIHAFEPRQEYHDLIKRNLALNGCDDWSRVRLHKSFVGSVTSLNTTTLDSLSEILFPCFIKIDVDGAELDVLAGALDILRRAEVRWLIETHSIDLEQRCEALLRTNGYVTKIVRNAWWRCILPEQRNELHNRWLVAAKAGDIAV